jgi:amino acid adenylation domain-containing protein/non-ribosomal peptide synthase protein (TIGR01720 family)
MDESTIAKRIAELPLEKRALLFQQLQKQKEREPAAGEAPRLTRQSRAVGIFPLSFAQQRLWFLNHYEPESPEYNIPQAFRIAGELDPEILRQAISGIVARHEALRTTFRSVEGEPAQVIAEPAELEMPIFDLSSRPPEEAWKGAWALASEDARQPFDLTRGPLLRAKLFRLAADEHLLYYNVHHISYDGWSMGIFGGELAALYDAFAAGEPSPLPELPVQYLDYALWQREWLQGEVLERQVGYWKRQLAGVPPLELPTDRPRPAVRTHNGAALPLSLDRQLADDLKSVGQQEGSTLFIVLMAAFKALLHHHTTQEDISVGTLLANRQLPEIERLIGFFANTLVMRTDLSGDPTFRELLRRERDTALDAYAHQDLPFEKLVVELNPVRDLARTPLFQVMLILLNAPGEPLKLPGLSLGPVPVDSRTSKLELTLYVTEGPGGLDSYLEYNSDLFTPASISRLLGHFRHLLEAVTADPDLRLSDLPLLSDVERSEMLTTWNATRVEHPRSTLHGLIEAQVAARPDAVAVELDRERLTYRELDERANRLAHHLRGLGVGPEVLVGVSMERSIEMLVGVLGVLKAGGAYVPLDPEYPKERLAYMLEDSRVPVLLTQERLIDKLPESGARVVAVDRDAAAIAAAPATAPPGGAAPENLAYVIYTSGSTGRPKGVQIAHAAVVNFMLSMQKRPGLASEDTLLAVTTLSFDIAGLELYLPLIAGARLILVSRDVASAGEQLAEVITRSGVTAMQATPATWRLLLGAGWQGSRGLKILCGGEALPRDLANQILDVAGSLWNVYGPTEATIWSTLEPVVEREGSIPIGRPLDNTEIFLLTQRLNPVPVGVPGELLIGGAGLSRGYRGRPDLTAEKFIPHPFAAEAGERLYRTGDLARHLPDGRIEFLGRIDHQVKVRGFRIELGDIEAAFAEHPGIAQAVVVAREDTPGNKRLAAYLVTAAGLADDKKPTVTELRAFLKEKLPEYMVPALFTFLPELPLTPNGKVDRRSLPEPDKAAAAKEYVAPRDDKEAAFAEIWAAVLGLERVGINDDFFEIGGDSLLVIRVVTKANKAGLGITTKQLFQNRTVADLAKVAGTTQIVADQGPVTGPLPFTPAQLHFLELGHVNPSFHSIGTLLEPRQPLPHAAPVYIARALEHVLERHDSLRVRMIEEEGGPRLVIDPPGAPANFLRVDLTGVPEEQKIHVFTRAVRSLVTIFDLARGPLLQGMLVDLEPDQQSLFLTAHFMAADVGSWQILLDDFDIAYRQLAAAEPVTSQPKTTSARQWAERLQTRALPGGMPPEERDFWLAQAPDNPPRYPMDHETGPNNWIRAAVEPVQFELDESEILLQQVPRAYGVQIDAILLTAILSGFESWIGSRSLPILLLGHGREALYDDMDLTRTIGWFNTIYPVFLDMGRNPDLIESAKALNKQLRAVPNGGTGYGILRYLGRDSEVQRHLQTVLQPQVFFNYMGPDNSKELLQFKKLQNYGGYMLDRNTQRMCPITLGGYIIEDKLLIKWEYNLNLHKPETIRTAAARCGEVLRWFVNDYRNRGKA